MIHYNINDNNQDTILMEKMIEIAPRYALVEIKCIMCRNSPSLTKKQLNMRLDCTELRATEWTTLDPLTSKVRQWYLRPVPIVKRRDFNEKRSGLFAYFAVFSVVTWPQGEKAWVRAPSSTKKAFSLPSSNFI